MLVSVLTLNFPVEVETYSALAVCDWCLTSLPVRIPAEARRESHGTFLGSLRIRSWILINVRIILMNYEMSSLPRFYTPIHIAIPLVLEEQVCGKQQKFARPPYWLKKKGKAIPVTGHEGP
jgi:hypothetical protein